MERGSYSRFRWVLLAACEMNVSVCPPALSALSGDNHELRAALSGDSLDPTAEREPSAGAMGEARAAQPF